MGSRVRLGGLAWLCLAIVGWLASPLPASAAGRTITIWWNQGFYSAEDQAMKEMVADWEKQSGDKIDITFYNGSDLPAKIISAITTGEVPDICYVDNGDFLLLPQNAWNDKIADVSDVVETQKNEYSETALTAARLYDNVTHKRSYFGIPLKQQALHNMVWKPMVEAAGYKFEEIPKDWNQYYHFFEDVQKKLRAKGQRVYGLGYSLATKDSDQHVSLQSVSRCVRGRRHRHTGRQAARGRPESAQGGERRAGRAHDTLQGGVRSSWGDQLGRPGQQQRLLRQADRHDPERDHLDRGRADGENRSVPITRSARWRCRTGRTASP